MAWWRQDSPAFLAALAILSLATFGLVLDRSAPLALADDTAQVDGAQVDGAQVDYVTDIKPILHEKCYACHGAIKQESELRLDAAQLIRKGGASGPALVGGNVEESLLLQRVVAADADQRMPPPGTGTPLSDQQINLVRAWIAAGAPAADESIPLPPEDHWAFRPAQALPAPNAGGASNPIDGFLAVQHQRSGIATVPPAAAEVLLRRVYLDLIGLPPDRKALLDFQRDPSPEAYRRVVDQLLDSPQYGQRWARHWMDVWRYSDPSGYGKEIRDGREHIWRWRDWIVDSLNADKGYDRMVVEMLAADEASPTDEDALRATGFLARNWYKFNRNVWLDNLVEHTSKAFLGITANCARCHDHKFDPIAQSEYYRLRAVFETHDVRDDPWPVGTGSKASEATGVLVRAYDAHLDRPTYRFEGGDENRPLEDEPQQPGIPVVLGGKLEIEPVALPVTAWYPALREESRIAQVQAARAARDEAAAAEQAARDNVERARGALAAYRAPNAAESTSGPVGEPDSTSSDGKPKDAATDPVLRDAFDTLNAEQWTIDGGRWETVEGRLRQSQGDGQQYRLVSRTRHPRDFRLVTRLRITGGELYRSVGIGFDRQGQRMHSVYLSAYASGPKVQVSLQDEGGGWSYPQEGAASFPVELKRDYLVELAVRDTLLNVRIDDQLVLVYRLPVERSAGQVALWTFSAQAEFDELRVEPLGNDRALAKKPAEGGSAPVEDRDGLQWQLRIAESDVEVARLAVAARESELHALVARQTAECLKYGVNSTGDTDAWPIAAKQASQGEREAEVARLRLQVAQAARKVLLSEQAASQGEAKAAGEREKAEQNRKALETKLNQAIAAVETESTDYKALGSIYPRTSSGRRLALARWIVDRGNPLTARVAVNHVWLRHFDRPLVERVFDFGLRTDRPSHADVLDWLAVWFMDHDWSMKQLHRLIVTSQAYQRSSSVADAPAASLQQDPDNLLFWRMNARRMEAEVVRDSLLRVSGNLDLSFGGPPIDHTQGQTVPRRSLYFRQDKERQMTFLELFDGAKVNECYQRKATVAPQQALAMFNSPLAWTQAGALASRWSELDDGAFVRTAFEHLLCRAPTGEETEECRRFLAELADAAADPAIGRRQLTLVLLNHHDFITIR